MCVGATFVCMDMCVCVCVCVHPCVSCECLCLQKIMYAVLLGGSTQRAEGFLSGAMLVSCTFHVVFSPSTSVCSF